MNKPTLLLLDCDILRYELGSILSKGDTITIGGHQVDVPQSRNKVEKLVKEKITHIIERSGCTSVRGYLSEGKNFRFERASIQPYKGNRTGYIKPYHWKTVGEVIRDFLEDTINCELFEADDHMANDQDVDAGTTCIGSRDKDLRGRGGWHYSWGVGERSPEKPLEWIHPIEGTRWFYTQCLTGDSTDHILGCAVRLPDRKGNLRRKGVGPKEAQILLSSAKTEQEMFDIVAAQYQKHCGNLWEEYLLENGTLLFMSHTLTPWEDMDETKELLNNYKRGIEC